MKYVFIQSQLKPNQTIRYQTWITIALESILFEAASFPCFGLVSSNDNGCHSDMDYHLFCRSQATFETYFKQIILLVQANSTADWEQLRQLGCEQERRMFQATNGVNTHKGLIFSFGIIFYQLVYAEYYQRQVNNWVVQISQFCQPLKADFKHFQRQTSGEICYQTYQVAGARGQALTGYQIIFEVGLPFFHQVQLTNPTLTTENYVVLLLVFYLSHVDDTTLMTKIGYQNQQNIKAITTGWISEFKLLGWNHFYQTVLRHNVIWKQANVSPGGCADLVVVTLFLSKILKIS